MSYKIFTRFFMLVIAGLFLGPLNAFAVDFSMGEDVVAFFEGFIGFRTGFLGFLLWLFPLMIASAVVIATVVIIFAGFQWMAGGISPPQVEQAKKKIGAAVLGLAVALFSWMILNTINPAFTTDITLPGEEIRNL